MGQTAPKGGGGSLGPVNLAGSGNCLSMVSSSVWNLVM